MKANMLKWLFGLVVVAWLWVGGVSQVKAEGEIYFFFGLGCPHCARVDEYFRNEGMYEKYPIAKKEIYFDRENAVFYNRVLDDLGVSTERRGVPTVVMGETVLHGDVPIMAGFVEAADEYLKSDDEVERESRIVGKTDLTLWAVVGASLVDAINPCAFAVLIILMSTVLMSGDRKRALRSGLGFSAAIFVSYFLMGLGLYRALEWSGSGIFFRVVGWLAILLGLFNLKDWLWYGKGGLMEVPLSWRPRLKKLIGSVTSPLGAFGAGFLVSLFLLPCTSGPYVVILGMLAERVESVKAISYLVLYNLIFVAPMVGITLAVYKGLEPSRVEEWRQTKLKTLHLVAGLVLIGMGVVILSGWV